MSTYDDSSRLRQFAYCNLYIIRNQSSGEVAQLCTWENDLTVTYSTLPPRWANGTFVSAEVTHAGFKRESESTISSVTFTIKATSSMFRRFFMATPTSIITIDIYRCNKPHTPTAEADCKWMFTGELAGQAFQDSVYSATFSAASLGYDKPAPRVFYQRFCNHDLYGPGCTLNAESFKSAITVSAVDKYQKSLTCTIAGNIQGAYFSGGYILEPVHNSKIMIVTGQNGAGTSRTLLLQYWIPELLTLTTGAYAYQGCPHTINGCKRFNNLANFLGFPGIPTQNPVYDGVA